MSHRDDDTDPAEKPERIAKIIARAGLCSRRAAERLIEAGRVAVDGQTIASPALDVTSRQRIEVDGQVLPQPESPRLFRFHKPAGCLVAERDPQGRPTIYDKLPAGLPRLMPVGRLDFNSEGLLLLTNDGGLKRRLELPATGWTRRYRVRVHGRVDQKQLDGLAEGVTVSGINYGPIEARLERQQGDNAWIMVALREGKNREIRRVMNHLDLEVNRLIRTAYGPFQLGRLARGKTEEVPRPVLAEQLGASLAGGEPAADEEAARPRNRKGWAKAKPRANARPGANRKRRSQQGNRDANRRR